MSISSPSSSGERLHALLFEWQIQAEQGTAPNPEVLCQDCPEMAAELAKRIQAVCQIEQLQIPQHHRSDDTTPWVSSGDSWDSVTSATLPGYGVLEPIGRGGMGVVYKAYNLALDRHEAVKMIRTGEFASLHELSRFRFEAEATAKLTHPNIITVYQVGELNGQPYLAMQWIDGCNLSTYPRETPVAAAALLAKVARAVHFAHERGILHRDLKPHNILVDSSGEPFVADFGIARPLDRKTPLTEVNHPVGTPAYMSPEQSRCEAHLTVASDLFSLGVVLYERLSAQLPFQGSNHYQVLEKVRSAEPERLQKLNPSIDRDLEAICLKCLAKDPQERYSRADELADDLERYVRGEPVSACPPGFWDWLTQLARIRPEQNPNYSWPVTAWFGAILLAINFAVFVLVQLEGSAIGVWMANVTAMAGMAVILWWYMLHKFRLLPPTERHSLIIAAGCMAVYLSLTVAYVPLSCSALARDALGMYPALAGVCGLGLFVLGSTNWSRFFPVGLGVIALQPVLVRWPESSPLIFAVVVAGIMWVWSYLKRVTFGRVDPKADEDLLRK